MKTIAIIPARGGSKRLPGKNIALLGGIPLIAHSILYAKANPAIIDAVYVTTDDPQIRETAIEYGAEVIDRPASISGDFEPTISAIQHALMVLDDAAIENVILLQPTNPLRQPELLGDAFAIFSARNLSSLFTVSRNSHKLGKIADGRFQPFNYTPGQRSQDLEPLYFENGLLYISRRSAIIAGDIITIDAFPYETTGAFSHIDIDTEADFQYAAYLLKTNLP